MINLHIHSMPDFWLGFAAACFAMSGLIAISAPFVHFIVWPWLVEKFRKKKPPRTGGGLLI